jgi:hypothetical protein
MVMMPEQYQDVTLESARADLARWAVSLRRAHAAGTGQTTGVLARQRRGQLDPERADYCCLGVWCEIARARGLVEREHSDTSDHFSFAGPAGYQNTSTLPASILLANSDNPDLLCTVSREEYGEDLMEAWRADCWGGNNPSLEDWLAENAQVYCAADLNDDHGLNFGQIADVVVWRFQLTPEELADAELEPRVELVEGPGWTVAYDGPGTLPF